MDERWYAVRTRSRHEQVAASLLAKKSFDIFFPKVNTWSKRKDRKVRILKPLFSGYLFIRFELTNERWLDIKKTQGVVDLVVLGKDPEPIPENQIMSIKTIVDSGVTYTQRPFLSVGDKVTVTSGPLQGAIGVYLEAKEKKGKLVVSVDLLNRSIEVEVDETDVDRF